jgi:hypothetical protein
VHFDEESWQSDTHSSLEVHSETKHAIAPGLAGGATSGFVVAVATGTTEIAPMRPSFCGTLDGSSTSAEHAPSSSAANTNVMQEIIP